jgi:hypothetical protein
MSLFRRLAFITIRSQASVHAEEVRRDSIGESLSTVNDPCG